MFKNILMILLLGASCLACYQPERNCSDFKTGAFSFEYPVGDTVKIGRFVRDANYSVDYYEGKVDSATIRWTNNCEFVLQDINSKAALSYKIISTTDSSYTFQYKSAVKNPDKKLIVKTGTAIKIK